MYEYFKIQVLLSYKKVGVEMSERTYLWRYGRHKLGSDQSSELIRISQVQLCKLYVTTLKSKKCPELRVLTSDPEFAQVM